MPSKAHAGDGPIASTVREPAAIWVRPASICSTRGRGRFGHPGRATRDARRGGRGLFSDEAPMQQRPSR